MCLAMGILWGGSFAMGLGIVVGLIGIVLIAVNYPLYQKFLAVVADDTVAETRDKIMILNVISLWLYIVKH